MGLVADIGGCCRCCGSPACCLRTGQVCFNVTGSIFGESVDHVVYIGEVIGVDPQSGQYLLNFAYTDPVTEQTVCMSYPLLVRATCQEDNSILWEFIGPTAEGAVVVLDSESNPCSVLLQPGSSVTYSTTTAPAACLGTQSGIPVTLPIPEVPDFGNSAQSFGLTFTPNFGCPFFQDENANTVRSEDGFFYNDFTLTSWGTANCVECSGFDGGDVPGPNPGEGVPADSVKVPCCGVEGVFVKKLLTLAMTSVVPGTCEGCLDLLIGLTYQRALHAWVGNAISCGNFVTVYFFCYPGLGPEGQTDGYNIYVYCGGTLLAGSALQTGQNCNPLNVSFGLTILSPQACCPSGSGTIIANVFEPV